MKYLEQYIEEKIKIKILGELTTRECCEGDGLGVSLVIDGYEPGIEIWYADYSNWLEEKLEAYEKEKQGGTITMITFEKFRDEVLTAMNSKTKNWRNGQFVFNYIDEKYGVARSVQFIDGVDCFYDDSKIEDFITRSYDYIKDTELSDKY
jgi:hypothetical protein